MEHKPDWREQSRGNWVSANDDEVWNDVKAGSLQRIADALELIAESLKHLDPVRRKRLLEEERNRKALLIESERLSNLRRPLYDAVADLVDEACAGIDVQSTAKTRLKAHIEDSVDCLVDTRYQFSDAIKRLKRFKIGSLKSADITRGPKLAAELDKIIGNAVELGL